MTPEWISVATKLPGAGWVLYDMWYHPEGDPENDGTINVYALAFDKNDNPIFTGTFHEIWGDGTIIEHPFKNNGADQAQSDFGMYNSFNPGKGESGPYAAKMKGNSDTVFGMGLPLNRHVQYWLIWKYVKDSEPTPINTTLTPEQLEQAFEYVARRINSLVRG